MALVTSYSSLVTSVQNYLARGDLATDAPGFIQNWEEKFYRAPKNWGRWMEQELSETIASGVIPVPADYLQLQVAWVVGNPSTPLSFVTLEELYGRYPRGNDTGLPRWMSRSGSEFVFGPQADDNYDIEGLYWGKPTLLRSFSADAAAHWLIVNAPDIPLYGALLEAVPFLKNDNRIPVWQAFYKDALQDYRDMMQSELHTQPAVEVLG